jgi:hypothetical protein
MPTIAALPLYRWAAHRRPQTVVAAAIVGIVLRMGLAGVLLTVVAGFLPSVTALALGCVIAVVAALIAEAAVALRDPRLFWIDPHARERAAA